MSFAALKNIPCPKGNSCTAFQCLFGHEKDKDKGASSITPSAATGTSSSSTTSSSQSQTLTGLGAATLTRSRSPDANLNGTDTPSSQEQAQAQGPPRKRQRTEAGQEHPAAEREAEATGHGPQAGKSKTPSKPVNPSRGASLSKTPDGSLATQATRPASFSASTSASALKRLVPPPASSPSASSSLASAPSASSHSPSLNHQRHLPPIHKDPATPSESRPPFTPQYTDSKPSPIRHTSVASSTVASFASTKIPTSSSSSSSSSSAATPTVPPSPSPAPNNNQTTAQTPKPRKAESLNPRFLHKAPSSYETRLKLVKLLHTELARLNSALKKELEAAPKDQRQDTTGLVLSDQQLIWKALDDEERAAVDKPSIYNNVLRNLIMQYKRMAIKQWREERVVARDQQHHHKARNNNKQQQHHHQHAHAHAHAHSASVAQPTPKKIVTGLTPAQEVQMLRHLITPIDKLAQHGYVSTAPTEEEVQKAREGLAAAQGWEKCDRCTKRFQVIPDRRDDDGSLTTGGKCTYHWGKTYIPERAPGDRTRVPKRYRCCGQEIGDSPGCTDAPHHVFKATDPKRLATVLNFAETPANPDAAANNGAVCFDCEMCYTVNGLELVRLTATAWPSGRELLDTLVLPVGQILDLNSRFSGVWPDDLARAVPWSPKDTARLKTAAAAPAAAPSPRKGGPGQASHRNDQPMKVVGSPQVARDLLFSLLSPQTPLIGHGLENDLNSVRIIHPTIIDTVLLHPHKHGLPFRYGLKMLMDTLLNRKIQVETDGKVQGHDSAEDARAAGELVHLKVMEKWQEMRFSRWTIDKDTGAFVEPPDLTAPAPGLTVEFLEAAH